MRRLHRADDAVAAVEFALVFPLAMLILLGTVELSRSFMTQRKLMLVANTVGQLVSSSGVAAITATSLADIRAVAPLVFPEVQKEAARRGSTWSSILQITTASVRSVSATPSGCKRGCAYNAGTMLWAYGSQATSWSCNTGGVTAVSLTATPAPSALPGDALSDGALIAVQVVFTYKPLFSSHGWAGIASSKTFTVGAYFKPRNFSQIVVDTTDASGVKLCVTQW